MDEETQPVVVPSQKFQWSYVPWGACNLLLQVARAVEEALGDMTERIAAHHNWLVDQKEFADKARADIESISESGE